MVRARAWCRAILLGARTGLRRVPGAVWAITALFTSLLVAWSILVPLYEGPDEPNHLDLVLHLADGGDQPDYNTRYVSVGVFGDCLGHAYVRRWCSPPPGPTLGPTRRLAADAPGWRSGPSFADLGGDAPSTRQNQLAQHPPLYYRSMAAVLSGVRAVTPGSLPLASELALLRLVNVLLVAPLPLLGWFAARRVGLGDRVATVAAALPLAIPQLTHIGSTLNNDNLLVLAGSVVTAACAAVLGGSRSWRPVAVLAVAAPVAALTKATGTLFVVPIAAAYAYRWWVDRDRPGGRRGAVVRLGAVAVSVVVFAAWWYVRNRLRHGTFSPSIDSENIDERLQPPGFVPDVGDWVDRFFAFMPARFFGWFGWFSARATFRLLVASAVFAAVLVVVGLLWPRRTASGADDAEPSAGGAVPSRIVLALLFLPGPLLLATVVGRAWKLYERSGQFPFLQGRYLFPAVVAGAVVAAAGADRLARRWALAVLVAWAAVMQVDGVRTVLRTYWGPGDGGVGDQVDAMASWARLPGFAVWAIAAAVLVATAAVVAAAVRAGRSELTGRPDPALP